MSPQLRVLLAASAGLILALVIGVQVANEGYLLAAGCAVLAGWLLAEKYHPAWPETWALALVLVGYVLGNRGFAQQFPIPSLPLLPAEFALAICLPVVLTRGALGSTTVLGRDPLGVAILFWILTGVARLGFDLRDYGWLALRDYATYYYATFFFIARALARNPDSVRILRASVTCALAVLPLLYLLANIFDEFFLTRLLVRGIPVFYYKEDLVAAYLFAGYFFLLAPPQPGGMAWRMPVAAACFVTAFTIGSSRAAIVALVVASGWWIAARRWQPLKLQAALVAAGLAVLTLMAVAEERPFNQSRLYTLYEHLASMVDLPGTGSYASEGRQYVGDNNRFRLVWWKAVATETWETNPVLGMGFGHDLAARFQSTYDQDLGDEFTTRSPHSILFTLLGRTGLLGLAGFAVIVSGMARKTLRVVRAVRIEPAALGPLGWWSVCWTILVSACFGVVLEGPMGAVIFWTLLGLAVAEETRQAPDGAETVAHLPETAGAAGVGPSS